MRPTALSSPVLDLPPFFTVNTDLGGTVDVQRLFAQK